jgi:flagellar biosynthesis protein FlhF
LVVRRFFAVSTRECLRLVREALGKDALILANRAVPGGVEIMAVSEQEVAAVTGNADPTRQAPSVPSLAPEPLVPAASPFAATSYAAASGDRDVEAERPAGQPATRISKVSPESPASAQVVPSAPPLSAVSVGSDGATRELADEIRLLRGVVEGQLSGFAWHQMAARAPIQVELLRELLTRGFGGTFSRDLAARLASDETLPRALRWVKTHLVDSLPCVPTGEDIVSRGGVYALVGPTGVGKTTTVAKIAASCTLQHGPSQVALVTTDSYRIGAVDQLRIYGRILGVPVFVAKDDDDLGVTLAELQGRRLVLIDTVGMNQRDRRVADQVAMLSGHGRPVSRLLLLSAVAQGEALEDVVRCYRGDGLAGCILTKVDESVSLGGAIDVILRARLPLHYVTNGQRVPEDLHLASPLYLVDRAFRTEGERGGFQATADEMPLLFAARSGRLAQASGA